MEQASSSSWMGIREEKEVEIMLPYQISGPPVGVEIRHEEDSHIPGHYGGTNRWTLL